MAIQVRRGNEVNFDPNKMLPGEWAVSLDTKYVRMCFSPGVCVRMATYEGFEEDMARIEAILEEAESIEEAIEQIQTEINITAIEVENYAKSAEQSALEAKEYAEAAAESAEKAEAITGPVVSGLKGSAETDYRTGQVTITPENLGLGDVLENIGINLGTLGYTKKNLLKNTATSTTIFGVTFTVNSDGSITTSGTALEQATFNIGSIKLEAEKKYKMNGCPSSGGAEKYFIYLPANDTGRNRDYGGGSELEQEKDTDAKISICVRKGVVMDNVTFYPMIRYADITDDTWEPYVDDVNTKLDTLIGNMLKAEVLTTKALFSISADDVQGFFAGVGKFAVAQGIQLNETMHLKGEWSNKDYFTVFCTYHLSGNLMMFGYRSLGNAYFAKYNITEDTISIFYQYANTAELAKYLPLAGGTLTDNLYTKTLLPSADVTDNIGYTNLAYNVIFAKAFSINKGGKSYGDIQIITEGTEEATGTARLMVGNITPRGTAGNARGVIVLPGVGKGITQITPSNNGDSNIEVLLPSSAGTLALKSDITALNVLTEVEQTTVAYFIDYIFSNLPVSTTTIYCSIFLYNGYCTYSGIKPVDNYASFIIHGYGIRAIHMQLQNGVWVYSAMDNK